MPRAARRQEIPTERTITNGALKNQYRLVQCITELMANTDLDADLATRNRQPIVAPNTAARPTATHSMNITNIHSFGPITGVIHHERIKVFLFHRVLESAFLVALDLPHFESVRLAHNQKHLNRLAHVRWLAIGIWKILCH